MQALNVESLFGSRYGREKKIHDLFRSEPQRKKRVFSDPNLEEKKKYWFFPNELLKTTFFM